MAGHHVLTNPVILFGSYNVTGDTKSVELTLSVADLDDSCFGSTAVQRLPGLEDASLSFSGSQDLTDNGQDETMWDAVGTSENVVSLVGEEGVGSKGWTFKNLETSYSIGGEHGSIAPFSASAVGQTVVIPGTEMHSPLVARTATGTGTSQTLGAVSSVQRLYGALHVVEVSGTTPTLDVTVESDDDTGYPSAVTRITFTQATARTSQFTSVAGPITDTHYRVRYTIGGTNPSFKFFVLVGIAT